MLAFSANVFAQDTNFWIFLCFGQSNMEGSLGIEEHDNSGVDDRFQVLATVDFPKQNRTKGKRDCANQSMRISRVDPLGTLWLAGAQLFCPISEGLAKQLFGFGELVLAVAARRSGDGTFGDYGRAVFASRS